MTITLNVNGLDVPVRNKNCHTRLKKSNYVPYVYPKNKDRKKLRQNDGKRYSM